LPHEHLTGGASIGLRDPPQLPSGEIVLGSCRRASAVAMPKAWALCVINEGPMLRSAAAALLLAAALGACTSTRDTNPQRTATEQLLISTAADRAAEQLKMAFPNGEKVLVDATNFEGYDSKYAIGAVREHVLKEGGHLVVDRSAADVVVEIRAGALSVDEKAMLVGVPSFSIPLPLSTSAVKVPEIAFFKRAERLGVAKIAATGYGAKDGAMTSSSGPQYGFAHERRWVVMLLISWMTTDLRPEEDEPAPADAGSLQHE
jgi:hypothetical protein